MASRSTDFRQERFIAKVVKNFFADAPLNRNASTNVVAIQLSEPFSLKYVSKNNYIVRNYNYQPTIVLY